MKNPNVVKAKEQATRVAARLGELGFDIKHGQALEVVAAVFGAENWHAYAAELKKPQASSELLQASVSEQLGYQWISVTLLAGDGNFRGTGIRLATSASDAIAQVKAQLWTDAVASLYPAGVIAVAEAICDMSTLFAIETWLRDCEVEESELDEAVHTAMQECELTRLNSLIDENDQEDHISAVEKAASNINNSGLSAQLDFLFDGYEKHIPGFVHYLQEVLDLTDWYSQRYSRVIR